MFQVIFFVLACTGNQKKLITSPKDQVLESVKIPRLEILPTRILHPDSPMPKKDVQKACSNLKDKEEQHIRPLVQKCGSEWYKYGAIAEIGVHIEVPGSDDIYIDRVARVYKACPEMLKNTNPSVERYLDVGIEGTSLSYDETILILPPKNKIEDIEVSLNYSLNLWHDHVPKRSNACFSQFSDFDGLSKSITLQRPIETTQMLLQQMSKWLKVDFYVTPSRQTGVYGHVDNEDCKWARAESLTDEELLLANVIGLKNTERYAYNKLMDTQSKNFAASNKDIVLSQLLKNTKIKNCEEHHIYNELERALSINAKRYPIFQLNNMSTLFELTIKTEEDKTITITSEDSYIIGN